jgi:hypothetical protein
MVLIREFIAAWFLSAARHFKTTDLQFSKELRKQAFRLLGLSEA